MEKHPTNIVEFLHQKFPIKEHKNFTSRYRSKLIVTFRPRVRKKASKSAKIWLYIRITVDGITTNDISSGIDIKPDTWDSKSKRFSNNSPMAEEKNRAIDQIKHDLTCLYNDLRQKNIRVTAQMLKELYKGSNLDSWERLKLTTYYNAFLSYHLTTISKDTLRSYNSRFNLLVRYLSETSQKNVTLDQISPKWALAYHRYIAQNIGGLDHARRAIKAISMVLDYAVIQNDLESNPLKSLRLPRSKRKPNKYLMMNEITLLQSCPYFDDRLQKVVDCFLFQCFTGMGFNELLSFSANEHLKTDTDGQVWIMIHRGKTGTLSMIPVIKQTHELLEKYNYNLPVISNQKLNEYIKQAAQIAGIERYDTITTHVGRKTAGTFLLNHGVPLETVSKVLGHKSIKITQMYYAELLTDTIKTNFKNSGLL